MQTKEAPFALYLHIPYCVAKCPYCDFNSYAVGDKHNYPEEDYVGALLLELAFYATQPGWHNRQISSIFIGGGTPSLFSEKSFERLISGIKQHFDLLPEAEITLEANPGTISEKLSSVKLAGFRRAGINRISLGSQSFNQKKLSFLGRIHSPKQTETAIEAIKQAGFENFNLDLIFAVKGETLEEWCVDVQKAISFNPAHISAYSLTIEPGTEFGKRAKRGTVLTCDDDVAAPMYYYTIESLENAGYRQYEISNYAKPDAQCRHNLAYWSGTDYLGLGAGAHSYAKFLSDENSDEQFTSTKFHAERWWNWYLPQAYIQRANSGSGAVQTVEKIDKHMAITELFYTSLRTKSGVSLEKYRLLANITLIPDELQSELQCLESKGFIETKNETLQLTSSGKLFHDEVVLRLSSAAECI